jgi:hypothetical protein
MVFKPLLVLLGATAAQAAAQDAPPRFEMTPYAAYRVGGEFEPQSATGDAGTEGFELRDSNAAGLILDIRTAEGNSQWEVLYAQQNTEVETQAAFSGGPTIEIDVRHYQFGGTYLFDDASDTTVPFIALTAGLARFDAADAQAESYFSWSLGGVQLRADRRIGVRLEARAFGTVIDDDSALFCISSPATNACALLVEADVLYQLEARVGVVARF